jgi:hypothetical protein
MQNRICSWSFLVEIKNRTIGLWGLCYKGKDQRTDIKILFTGQDNATIGFFRNKVMDNRKR